MKLYFDLDSNRIVNDPNFKASVTDLVFKRGDESNIDLQFLSGTTALTATSGRSIIFGVKEAGKYDSSFLTAASAYTIVNNSYRFTPSFATSAINALLFVDSLSTNDIASVTTMAEFTWSDNSVDWTSSQTLNCTILNDVVRNNGFAVETAPDPIAWLNSQRPLPIGYDGVAPAGSNIDTVYVSALSGTRIATLTQTNFNTWTSDGNPSPPVSGVWHSLDRNAASSVFNYYIYNNNSVIHQQTNKAFGGADVGIPTYNADPGNVAWTNTTAMTAYWNTYDPGIYGQIYFQHDLGNGAPALVYINAEPKAPYSLWYGIG